MTHFQFDMIEYFFMSFEGAIVKYQKIKLGMTMINSDIKIMVLAMRFYLKIQEKQKEQTRAKEESKVTCGGPPGGPPI